VRGFSPVFWAIPGLGGAGSSAPVPSVVTAITPALAFVPGLVISGTGAPSRTPVEPDRRIDTYVVEMAAWDPSIGAETTFYFSHGTGFTTRGGDTPPHQHFDARLRQPVDITRAAFAPGATGGRTSLAFGDVVLANDDGALDELITYGFDGRRIVIRQGAKGTPYPDEFQTVFDGTMEHPDFTVDAMTIRLRDQQRYFDVPVQPNRYTGAGGVEGTADTVKGQPKPLVFGSVFNISPPLVDPGLLVYHLHDGAVSGDVALYDRGVPLAAGPDYASRAQMLTVAPAPGTFRMWRGEGYARLGAPPAGTITADVVEAVRDAPGVFSALVARVTDAPVFIGLQTFAALDPAIGAIGLYLSDDTTVLAALDQVAASVGAWWGVDGVGTVRLQVLDVPNAEPVLSITANDMVEPPARQRTTDPSRGLPIREQVIRYRRNYTVQTTDLAAGVSEVRRAQLAQEWRSAAVARASVATMHLLAESVTEDTLFVAESDALAEATRRMRLRGVQRHRFDVLLQLTQRTMQLQLGDVIGIDHPRFGLSVQGNDVGQRFVIIGLQPDGARRRLRCTVWGAAFDEANLTTRQQPRDLLVTDDGAFLITGLGTPPALLGP
jgi:hypothetical protein